LWDLTGKKVFLRADLNVPLAAGQIADTFRLDALRPTLDFIITKGATITLATHLGKPKGYDAAYSTAPLQAWLTAAGYDSRITLLENLRFDAEEAASNYAYAEKLKGDHHYYIDDAFASVHRTSASLTVLPNLFLPQERGIGFLIEKELALLARLKYADNAPFLLILGGNKKEKLELAADIDGVTDLLVCPGLTSFMTPELQRKFQKKNIAVHMPSDYLVGPNFAGPYSYKKSDEILATDMPLAIGPATTADWQPRITSAQRIFFNGPMGDFNYSQTTQELVAVLQTVAQSSALRVIGGGSSVAALHSLHLTQTAGLYCSTGGGSALFYLSNKTLPALDALR